ncbi:MAG: hypothetical protein M3354_09650, partial [Chloroflexota bacterium]|nr:hypothetical protein [Chloroflexota bacterium]
PRPVPAEPVVETGEAALAQPGGSTAEAARTDESAAKVGSAFSPSDAPRSVRTPRDAAAGTATVAESAEIDGSDWAQAGPNPETPNQAAKASETSPNDPSAGPADGDTRPPDAPTR